MNEAQAVDLNFDKCQNDVKGVITDPKNRYPVDAPDIQRLLRMHRSRMNMKLVQEYFRLFGKEDLLDEWLKDTD